MQAVLQAALDPEPTERELAAIDRSLSSEDQLVDAVRIMQRRMHIWRLLSSISETGGPRTPPRDFSALADLFRTEQKQLRADPVTSARQLRALTFAVSNPAFFAGKPPTAREIVTLLLDGIRVPGRSRPQRGTGG
jgi:hypothetical protein